MAKPNMWSRRGLVKPTFNLMGVTDLRQFLTGIDPWVQQRIIKKTVEEASKPIVSLAKSLVPSRTGALKKSLGSIVRVYPRTRVILAVIGARKGAFVEGKNGKARVARKGDKGGVLLPHKYSHLVEFGHMQTKGEVSPAFTKGVGNTESNKTRRNKQARDKTFVQGRPFLQPAFEAGRVFAENRIKEGFEIAIKREALRMQRKIAKMTQLIKAA